MDEDTVALWRIAPANAVCLALVQQQALMEQALLLQRQEQMQAMQQRTPEHPPPTAWLQPPDECEGVRGSPWELEDAEEG
ncbi:unnamed protein product [Prorocentrum cordatum]|uniref:Uncharacterized protein n=1 Tax=Prorocentrum cordatum TaxID=2364126 RepID=A0ABN9U9X5_9DINO|nr:unnamed protein product [Polarella glacialis]